MTGRVCLVTGGNSGVGFEVAKYLAEGGNDVVIASRDEQRAIAAIETIQSKYPNALVSFMKLDFCSLDSVREFAREFIKKKKKIHVLVNNAGIFRHGTDRQETEDKLEMTMGVNHLGPFLLTNLLLDYLKTAANITGDARIINISSKLHDHQAGGCLTRGINFLDLSDFQLNQPGAYSGLQAYKNSKLCNILFTYELANRLRGTGVTVNAVHPGFIPETNIQNQPGAAQCFRCFSICCFHYCLRCFRITRDAKTAGKHIASLATSDKYFAITGHYFYDGKTERSSSETYDDETQHKVWDISCKLVNLPSETNLRPIDLKPV